MADPKLEKIANAAFPEADHRAMRCLAALQEAVAEERKALREIVKQIWADEVFIDDWSPGPGLMKRVLAALDAREVKK